MAQLISELWEGLRDAGFPEVMLYLPDNSASRCHWDETVLIGELRVALLADQDRKIVRILPVDTCTGIGIASPKGVDPSGYKATVHTKLNRALSGAGAEGESDEELAALGGASDSNGDADAAPVAFSYPTDPEPAPAPAPAPAKVDPLTSRWGMAMKAPARNGSSSQGHR